MEKERLAEYLEQYHMGALNAATSRELELTFDIKGIQVRHMVNALRRDGVPIASNGSGYFYAATDQEVRATIAHLTRRISGIAAAIRGLERTQEKEDTKQNRFFLDGSQTFQPLADFIVGHMRCTGNQIAQQCVCGNIQSIQMFNNGGKTGFL